MTEEEKAKHLSEYNQLLALFINFLKNIHSDSRQEAVEALMELRADLAVHHAFYGFHVDEEEAMQMLQNYDDNTLTKEEIDKRDRILAAVQNLIDFAVCEEYHVVKDTDYLYDEYLIDDPEYEINFNDADEMALYYQICSLYNNTYAAVENGDIEYAMSIAYAWIHIAASEYLTYWTMNDSHVRPWHMELQGFTALKDEFPSWMIPPIEWNCRCFLINTSGEKLVGKSDVRNVVCKVPQKPAEIDDTFSESVAKCGRIFGPSHNYFQIDESDKDWLDSVAKRIKEKYHADKK